MKKLVKKFLNSSVLMFVVGLAMFLTGFWMLSPPVVEQYGEAIFAMGSFTSMLIYLLALALACGGIATMIATFCLEKK